MGTNIFSWVMITINGWLENELVNSRSFDVGGKRSSTDNGFIIIRRKVLVIMLTIQNALLK